MKGKLQCGWALIFNIIILCLYSFFWGGGGEVEHRQEHEFLAEAKREPFSFCPWRVMWFLSTAALPNNESIRTLPLQLEPGDPTRPPVRFWCWLVLKQEPVCVALYLALGSCHHWPQTTITRLWSGGLMAERPWETNTIWFYFGQWKLVSEAVICILGLS